MSQIYDSCFHSLCRTLCVFGCICLQAVPDNVCKVAGCKAVWGYGNQLFVTAGSRKPFRGDNLFYSLFVSRSFVLGQRKQNQTEILVC